MIIIRNYMVWLIGSTLLGLFLFVGSAQANVNFPQKHNFMGQNLLLNGLGVRKKLFFKLYLAGLYLQAKSKDPKAILNSDKPMAMRLQITYSVITSEDMENAVRDGFKKSVKDVAPLQDRIEQLIAVFKKPIKVGDVYDFIYTDNKVTIAKNGQIAVAISGKDFKAGLFGIWLGDQPVHPVLKKQLLKG